MFQLVRTVVTVDIRQAVPGEFWRQVMASMHELLGTHYVVGVRGPVHVMQHIHLEEEYAC